MDEKERELFYFGSYITTNLILSDNTNINVKFNKIYSTVNIAVPSITFNNTINANSIVLGDITNINNLPDKDFTKDIIVNNNPSVIKIKKSNFFGKLSLELIQYSGANWASGNLVIRPFTLTYNSTSTTNLDSNYVTPYCYDSNIQFNQIGVDIDGEASGDHSGSSVSLSSDGSIVAIGAWGNDNNGSNSGHVRVYEWTSTAWVQRGADIDGEASTDNSGIHQSVSLSSDGSIVAIGAYLNDGVNGVDSGHVRVYKWNGNAWIQRGVDIDGEAYADRSGYSVSLSSNGNIVAIGAETYTNSSTGHVRVYEWVSSAWVQRGVDIDGEAANDYSGISVSLSSDGSIVAIGAYANDGVNGSYSGHVRVYEWLSSAWVQRGLDIDGEASSDYSGYSVSLSSDGTIVAIGAYGNNSSTGHVRVYQWNENAWVQRGVDIDGEAAGDQSGFSVSLSSDGSIVAIGSPRNDGNGAESGHVRVYHWNGTAWVKIGADIDGENNADGSGSSVSLSSDGSIVAIGAPVANAGSSFGHVRVYSMPSC